MGTDIHSVIQIKRECNWETFGPWYEERNYAAFALLANVRNGYGYSDNLSEPVIPYIQEKRGFPEGFNDDNMLRVCSHDCGWVTAKELSEYDYGAKIKCSGIITAEEFVKRHERMITDAPDIWFSSVSGYGIVCVDESKYWLAARNSRKQVDYVRISWTSRLYEMLGADFLNAVFYIIRLGSKHGMYNVRVVFGFSS